MPKFEFVPFLKKCVEVRATIARILPSIAIQMAKNPAVQGLDLTSINVLFSAGASLPNEVAEELTRKLKGVTVLSEKSCTLDGMGFANTHSRRLRDE